MKWPGFCVFAVKPRRNAMNVEGAASDRGLHAVRIYVFKIAVVERWKFYKTYLIQYTLILDASELRIPPSSRIWRDIWENGAFSILTNPQRR